MQCLQSQRHTFRAPAKPVQPPTPRASLLGLDRLAAQKSREKREAAEANGSRKKPRLEDDDDFGAHFKGEICGKNKLIEKSI